MYLFKNLKKNCYHVNIIYFCNKETRQNIFSMFITYSKVLEVLYFFFFFYGQFKQKYDFLEFMTPSQFSLFSSMGFDIKELWQIIYIFPKDPWNSYIMSAERSRCTFLRHSSKTQYVRLSKLTQWTIHKVLTWVTTSTYLNLILNLKLLKRKCHLTFYSFIDEIIFHNILCIKKMSV